MPRIGVANELAWPLRRHYDLNIGIEQYADEQGDWNLEVSHYPEVRMKRGHRFDGTVGRITPEILAGARAAGIPAVNTWVNSPVATDVPSVHVDYYGIGGMAAEHLYTRGIRRFVHIGWHQPRAPALHFQGVSEAAKKLGCTCSRLRIARNYEDSARSWERFVETIERAAETWSAPLGIAVHSDDLGRAVISELRGLGWSLPTEIALVPVGNDTFCQPFPSMSSIDSGYQRIGYEAARLLDALMRGEAPPNEALLVPPKELVIRQSTDAFAVKDPRVARALRFMADHSHLSLSVSDIAKAAGVARQNLDKPFFRAVGRTINDELIRLRIEQLKRLLVTLEDSQKSIFRIAGFGSESQAYRCFKQFTGETPTEYRKRRKHSPYLPDPKAH
jgi:LacI family transcriptional regulator